MIDVSTNRPTGELRLASVASWAVLVTSFGLNAGQPLDAAIAAELAVIAGGA